MKILLCLTLLLSTALSTQSADPLWWTDGEPPVIDSSAEPNNKGATNIGQAKHMVKSALAALAETAPNLAANIQSDVVGAGKPIPSLAIPTAPDAAWHLEQKQPLLLGQLKAISAPFYNRLHTAAPAWLESELIANNTKKPDNHLPWTVDAADDQNRAPATIGQVKAVFALHFDTLPSVDPDADSDGDGLPDAWEILHFGDIQSQTASGNDDGDVLTNILELLVSRNPTLNDSAVDISSRSLDVFKLSSF